MDTCFNSGDTVSWLQHKIHVSPWCPVVGGSFGRLSCATVVEPLRRKWVTRGRPWGVLVQPPFLSVLCYVTTDAVWPTSAVTPFPQQGTRISPARHLVIGRKATTVLSLPHPSSARCISNIWPLGSTPQGSSLNNEDMQHVLEGLTSEQLGHQCGLKKKIRFLKNILFLYVWRFAACMHVHARCTQRSGEGIGCPGPGVRDSCESPREC